MINTLETIYTIALVIAAICTTAFPLVYSFSKWYRWPQGIALMQLSITLSIAVDTMLVLHFWPVESAAVGFIIGTAVLTTLSASSIGLTAVMIHTNYFHARDVQDLIEKETHDHDN